MNKQAAVVAAFVAAGIVAAASAAPPSAGGPATPPKSAPAPPPAAGQPAAGQPATAPSKGAAAAPDALAERGRHLVEIAACSDCHTPKKMGPHGPEPDLARFLSGHPAGVKVPPAPAAAGPWISAGSATNTAFAGPWGVSYAANLTSDATTGLGPWTEQMFIATFRSGQHWGEGRDVMPPMPWALYAHMTDDELKAIWAYLMTVPAIKNEVPDGVPAPAGR